MDVWKFQVDQSSRFAETFLTFRKQRKTRLQFWEPFTLNSKIVSNAFMFPKLFSGSTSNFWRILSNIFSDM